MDIEGFSKLHWANREHVPELARMVQTILVSVEPPGITTSELMIRLGCPQPRMKALTTQLGHVRKTYPGLVTQGKPTNATFGKPSYKWHNAPGLVITGTVGETPRASTTPPNIKRLCEALRSISAIGRENGVTDNVLAQSLNDPEDTEAMIQTMRQLDQNAASDLSAYNDGAEDRLWYLPKETNS